MRNETKSGWFVRTYTEKVKHSTYDRSDVHGRIKKELVQFRMDITKALYQSTCRDRTIINPKRMKIIQDYLNDSDEQQQDRDEEEFRDMLFRIIDLVDESNSGLDYQALFNTYMKALMSGRAQNAKSAVNFILGQMRDQKRCEELITNQVLDNLMSLLKDPVTDETIKRYLLEIVNSYLEQECCLNGLSKEHLEGLIVDLILKYDIGEFLIFLSC